MTLMEVKIPVPRFMEERMVLVPIYPGMLS
jgi:hypothetical protein